jgi:hypothetical protein
MQGKLLGLTQDRVSDMSRLALVVCGCVCTAAACGDTSQGKREDARERSAVVPGTECVAKGADSTASAHAALLAAMRATGDSSIATERHVTGFERHADGVLIMLSRVRSDVLGGGALVWVPDGGCAVVRELSE